MVEKVDCQCPVPYDMKENEGNVQAVATYLEELAERVRAHEIRHVSVSVHIGHPDSVAVY